MCSVKKHQLFQWYSFSQETECQNPKSLYPCKFCFVNKLENKMNVAPCYVFKLSESGSHSSKCALVNPTGFVPAFQATLPASTRLQVLKTEGKTKQGSIRQPSFFRIPNSLQCRLNFKGSWGGDATQHSFSLIIVGHTNYPRG